MNGAPRRIAWAEESPESKLRLIINELDEMDVKFDAAVDKLDTKFTAAIDKVVASVEAGNKTRNNRLNWILVTFVTMLIAIIGAMVAVVMSSH